MPEWDDTALILSVRPHGESSSIVNLMTRHHGRHAGLVRGGQSRSQRGVLQPGNEVEASWRARLAEHLGSVTVEISRPNASAVLDQPICLAGLASACAVLEGCLPEREPHPGVFDATTALFGLVTSEADAEIWLAAYIRWEIAMLDVAGYALDLGRCGVTGEREGLAYVSPRTGVAVTSHAAGLHKPKLLALPRFLGGMPGDGDDHALAQDLLDGMRLTRHFLERKVFGLHHLPLPAPRQRLDDLVQRRFAPSSDTT
ncbi:DNA repair protein RecO [Alphaproteobacteria bacterium LSUCC0684]